MEDSNKPAAKRNTNVVSRRAPVQASAEEIRPLTLPPGTGGTSKPHPAPPRSGPLLGFGSARLHPQHHKGEDKRRYHVNIPTRMLTVLGVIFLAVPLLIFTYKELHIHDHHDEAHYKVEKYINIDTEGVIEHFSDRAQHNPARNTTKSAGEAVENPVGEQSDKSKGSQSASSDKSKSEKGQEAPLQQQGALPANKTKTDASRAHSNDGKEPHDSKKSSVASNREKRHVRR